MTTATRAWVICTVALVAAGWATSNPANSAEQKTKKLNVLFLMSDDLRPELGCYGHPQIKTPNIDRLAEAGVRFDRAYIQYPLCNPSRASMLTGRYPTETEVLDNQAWFGALHPELVSLPKHFKANGYASLRAGKIFHGGIDDVEAWTAGAEKRNFEGARRPVPKRANRAKQSDRQVVLDGDGQSHGDYKTADRAIDFLREHKDKPFFLACGFTKPHSPPTAPKKFYDLYDADEISLPPDFATQPAAPAGHPTQAITPNGDLFIRRDASPEEAKEMIRAYWASVSWMDWNVGRVVDELDRLGLRDNTVVVFWGDHGYHLGEKGKWAKHGSLYEIGTRVPLVILAPGAAGNGHACARVVESLDIYPTLVELCGLQPPAKLSGRSLVPLLNEPQGKWDEHAFTVAGNAKRLSGIAVRTGRYRYAEYEDGQAMLFDHETDPHELKNLADDPDLVEVKTQHAELIKRFRRDHAGDTAVTAPPQAERERLKLSSFYEKYTSAGGFPIVSSTKVADAALLEAAYLIDRMLEGRDDIRDAIIASRTRLAVMAPTELTTDIPEHSDLTPKEYWDRRARGLGATDIRPAVSCGEENLLCCTGDPYSTENILVHEFAHVIHQMGLKVVDPQFDTRLREAFEAAKGDGLWSGKYAGGNRHEYWAEGVQSYFDTNRENDNEHNHVDTREELREYDPRLFALVDSVFRSNPWRYTRADQRTDQDHLKDLDRASLPTFSWPERLRK